MKKLFFKYKYFIPLIGFIIFFYDVSHYEDSSLEKYYGELLGLGLIASFLTVQLPLIVGCGFLLINLF